MSLIFATQLTAIATAALAVFAVVTAWYARRAFLKQSQEVRAIEQQVADAQKLARQQAKLLKVQSAQLALQRQQFDEQRQVNARQVSLALKLFAMGPDGGGMAEATVSNASDSQQAIYAARLTWYLNGEAYEGYEKRNPELVGTVLAGDSQVRSRTFPPGANLAEPADCGAILTYRDSAGLNWIRTADGSLWQAQSDQVPPSVRTLLGSS